SKQRRSPQLDGKEGNGGVWTFLPPPDGGADVGEGEGDSVVVVLDVDDDDEDDDDDDDDDDGNGDAGGGSDVVEVGSRDNEDIPAVFVEVIPDTGVDLSVGAAEDTPLVLESKLDVEELIWLPLPPPLLPWLPLLFLLPADTPTPTPIAMATTTTQSNKAIILFLRDNPGDGDLRSGVIGSEVIAVKPA
ncbi:hypothetical protein BGX26_000868, partial [Mortierella sp. AD094]